LSPVALQSLLLFPMRQSKFLSHEGERTMNEQSMQQCIDECLNCHRVCLGEAMTHCLEAGGQHTEPTHFRLMINCAEMCQTSANFMLSGSPLHAKTCGVCAEVCTACAESCESIPEMEKCAETCRRCAEACRKMAQMVA